MSAFNLKALKDDALFYMGENVEKVQQQWVEDFEAMYQFDHYVDGDALPMRFKVLLKSDADTVSAMTLNLCVPIDFMENNALTHLTLRSLIEIFDDQMVGILYFENQSVLALDNPKLVQYKNTISAKNVNLLQIYAYLRGTDGYAEFESLYALEFGNLRKAETLKSFTELYCGQRITSNEGRAKELFSQPMIDFYVTKSEQDRASLINTFNQFKEVLAAQVNESLSGTIKIVASAIIED